ncbi:MAG: NADPH-dependent glutamate synthase [Promethearchaeota archaeon]
MSDEKPKRKPKKKVIKPRVPMPMQDPKERIKNFDEVELGYTKEMALEEASRCLQCPKPKCVEGCPAGVPIPQFIKLIREEKFIESAFLITEHNILPAVCGRVCPQEDLCEGNCVLGKKYKPVAIGNLQYFVADFARNSNACYYCDKEPPNGKKVACIGSGPASLAVASELMKKGYEITIYEEYHKPGGVLTYGIPAYRLPWEIIEYEVNVLKENGVKFVFNTKVGKDITFEQLRQDYDAIFIGIGANMPLFLRLPGENLKGVIQSRDYLRMVKENICFDANHEIPTGENVCIIGGGNVAMDCARTAKRFPHKTVTIVYRRAMEQLPARRIEIEHAQQEGVIFKLLTNPVRFIGDENGVLKEMEVISMRLGEPDSSGRPRPIPIEGSEFIIKTDLVINAIGNSADPSLTSIIPKLKTNRWGNIIVNDNMETNIKGVFAAGDIVTDPLTVVSAVGGGKKAAQSIHKYLFPESVEKEKSE